MERNISFTRQDSYRLGHVKITPEEWGNAFDRGRIDWSNSQLIYETSIEIILEGRRRIFEITQEYEDIRIDLKDLEDGHSPSPEDTDQQQKRPFSDARFREWFELNLSSLENSTEKKITLKIHEEFSPNVPRKVIRNKIKDLGLKKERDRPQIMN